MTLREMQRVMDGAARRDARLSWQAACYMRLAVHQPNDMPDDPGLPPRPARQNQADVVEVKAWMKAMAARGSDGN